MQTKIFKAVLLLVVGTTLFSFSSIRGGDSFQVWLNDKMVVQQFLHGDKSIKNIVLQESNYNDKLLISFSHCGQVGKERTITLKDASDKVVKKWTFANAQSKNDQMSCPVKEIMDLQKQKSNVTLKVIYSSRELPNGLALVSVSKSGNAVAIR